MTKIITSGVNWIPHPSWMAYRPVNFLNEGETGQGIRVNARTPRLYPDRYGPPLASIMPSTLHGALIINSDIELASPSLGTFIAPRVVTYARRIEMPSALINPWGIDLLAIPSEFYGELRKHSGWERLQIGAPWWDVAILTAAVLMGFSLQRIDAPVLFHQTHAQRWSWDAWQAFGIEARAWLLSVADATGHTDFPRHEDLHEFHHALRAWRDERTVSVHIEVAPPAIQSITWAHVNRDTRKCSQKSSAPSSRLVKKMVHWITDRKRMATTSTL